MHPLVKHDPGIWWHSNEVHLKLVWPLGFTIDAPKIKAPLLVDYTEDDKHSNAIRADYEAALKANNASFDVHVYPDTRHGFHNNAPPGLRRGGDLDRLAEGDGTIQGAPRIFRLNNIQT